ncbi:MAG: FAD-dependent oxidoreductase [Chromatocurvus sp.]
MITRRAMVSGLSALAATSLLAAAGDRPDVLVIGAGLSGLYAAMILEEMGATVRVVEGRNRIGGRLYTRYDLPGHPEVGGNSMAAGYGRAIVLARRLGLSLVDYAPRLFGGPPPELVMNGELIVKRNWPDSPHNPFSLKHRELMPWQVLQSELAGRNPLKKAVEWLQPENAALDIPLYDYLRMQGLEDAEISLGYDANPYYGDSSRAVSTLMHLFNDRWMQEQAGLGSQIYAVAGGNQRLPEAMAAALKNEVMLEHEVVAIESGRDRVGVTFRNGRRISASQVICSLPVSKLRDVQIAPRVSPRQRRGLSALRYQRNTLIFLVPEKPFWEEDGLSPTMWTNGMLGNVVAQRFDDDSNAVTGLVVQARGWSADYLDRLGEAAAGAAVIQEIERLRPAARGALTFGGWHSWWLDPFAAGDWAIYGPGQVTGILNAMDAPVGRIHFCGEHMGVSNRGMEGALESAERAAFAVSGVS